MGGGRKLVAENASFNETSVPEMGWKGCRMLSPGSFWTIDSRKVSRVQSLEVRTMKPFSAARVFAVVVLLGFASGLAQNSTYNVIRWKYGAPNTITDVTHSAKVEGLKTDNVHIYVALYGTKNADYNRAWVQIINRGNAPLEIDPMSAFLRGDQKISPEDPEHVANSIQRRGEARSQELASPNCAEMSSGGHTGGIGACAPTNAQMQRSKDILASSAYIAQWIRDKGMKPTTLAPGEEVKGAIIFKKEKKPAEYTLTIPVGSEVFEFPVSAVNKASTWD